MTLDDARKTLKLKGNETFRIIKQRFGNWYVTELLAIHPSLASAASALKMLPNNLSRLKSEIAKGSGKTGKKPGRLQ